MHMMRSWTVIIYSGLVLLCVSAEAATSLHVALKGSDLNPGTEALPFRTLERARDAIREKRQSGKLPWGGVTVWIHGGDYFLNRSFELTSADAATVESPITFRACPGESVRITGGKRISGFRKVRDAGILGRLDPACKGEIFQVDLKKQGISDFGTLQPRGFGWPTRASGLELLFNDRPMVLARWPNNGWGKVAGIPDGKDGPRISYEGDRPGRWSKPSEVWLHGYWVWDWADTYAKIKSIDLQKREITMSEPHPPYGYQVGARFRALSILEELDEPGEWYVDRESGILYFWPPTEPTAGRTVVSILEKPLVTMSGTSYVTIRGLTLEACRGNGVEIQGGSHNLVADCTIRNVGNNAVIVNGGEQNGVAGCDIYHIGDTGIEVSGGDRTSLTPARNYVRDSHIYKYSSWSRTYNPGIRISGVGNNISHNLIHDAPHNAILMSGNEHLIEFNEIHHVCTETLDAGAIYIGRDFTQRGNIIRHNYFHDLSPASTPDTTSYPEVMAVYLDDCASGTTVYGNLFYKAGRAVLIGGGRDNIVENNVFVECSPAVHVDARGLGWASFWFDGIDPTLMDRLKAVNHSQPPYSTRYPELANILDDEPAVPKGNRIQRNVCWGGRWLDILDDRIRSVIVVDGNLVDRDPHFLAPAKGDFRLKDDSPAYELGFERIPIENIGPRTKK